MNLRIPVLYGSMRHDRAGLRAARFIIAAAQARGWAPELVDAMELDLPILDRMYKEYPKSEAPPKLERLAQQYRAADGFLIVAGEYNHGIQPGLKNLLDHFLEEYFWRPSGIVCYSAGGFGGVRAAMQLRMTLAELGMSSIPSLLPIPRITAALTEDGQPVEQRLEASAKRFLDEFGWYAEALTAKRREGTPY